MDERLPSFPSFRNQTAPAKSYILEKTRPTYHESAFEILAHILEGSNRYHLLLVPRFGWQACLESDLQALMSILSSRYSNKLSSRLCDKYTGTSKSKLLALPKSLLIQLAVHPAHQNHQRSLSALSPSRQPRRSERHTAEMERTWLISLANVEEATGDSSIGITAR